MFEMTEMADMKDHNQLLLQSQAVCISHCFSGQQVK